MRIQLSDHFNYRKLLLFVAPSIVMMVFTSVYSVVDGLFVSNFAGDGAFTAIQYIFPMFMVLGSIGFMLGTGGSALVSKTLGEGDKERANQYFSLLVYVTLVIGGVIAVAGQFAVEPVAALLCGSSEGTIYEYCVLYGRILLAAQPFFILQNIFQSFFVTAEKPRLGLIVTASAGVLNMVLDAIFVVGCGWGLLGAALATAASQVFGGVFPVIYFALKNKSLLRLTKTKFYGKAVLKSCTNGSSEFFSNVSSAVVIILYNYQIRTLIGDAGVDAYAAMGYIAMVFFAIFMGYAVGSAPLMGYNYGAQNRDEMKNLFKKSLIIISVLSFAMFGLTEGLAHPLMAMFRHSEEITKIAVHGFRIYAVIFIMCGFNIYGSSLFTSLNNGLISALISFLRTIVFQVTFVMTLPLIMGINGVWSAGVFADVASIIITVIFVICYRKKYGYA
ncbi:MAG: MATE family efflux transporter [Clostridia bacterium]|nr:MATE family efflux transporter [Clostridia bacterium]